MQITKNVFASCVLGAFVCWYDFLLFAISTAIVFKAVFFPEASYLIPLMVFAAGYLARPIGGLIAGHIADRYGRKPILMTTLVITAASTVAIGLLPNYAQIGIAAPIILVVLRILQALAFGAELSGTDTIMYEYHKNQPRRGTISSFLAAMLPACMVAVSLMISLMFTWGKDAFMDWGWRVPFIVSGLLFVVAYYVRIRMLETPEFVSLQNARGVDEAPVKTVFRDHWKKVALGTGVIQLGAVWDFVALLFGFGFLVNTLGVSRFELNNIELFFAAIAIPAAIVWGYLGDRIGRLTVFNATAVASFLFIAPLLSNLAAGHAWIPVLLGFFIMSIVTYAQVPAFVAELFPTAVRQTGSSLVLNLGAMIGGVTPIICQYIYEINKNIYDVGWFLGAMGVIGLASGLLIRKHYQPESNAQLQ